MDPHQRILLELVYESWFGMLVCQKINWLIPRQALSLVAQHLRESVLQMKILAHSPALIRFHQEIPGGYHMHLL